MKKLFILFLAAAAFTAASAQRPARKAPAPQGTVYVDGSGVMRWRADNREVQGFGANYTVPFAHAYRSAKKLGVDPLRAIDQDVAQFARLGFDLFRVHVWDTEISDTLGNLLFNEHLHAFDYLLRQLADRNINYVLTPIAFWGNGWPEPDEDTPGFSHKYGKDGCLTHPEAIKAQENYLFQFMNHVNPYTGIAYKDDPRLIAVEVSNEPHHREAPEAVTAFVQRMVNAIRRSGYANPIFYNVSHSVHLAENYFQAGIQGGTFQWYPTGLGYQREIPANVLPNVDRYIIPFDNVIRGKKAAKLVYEFDPADIGRSYVYPAMARSFRTAGIQLATHFSYDPTFLAFANTEYNTHYMNLAYAPQKALALMISAEVFRRAPMYQDYGTYPANARFGDFRVSYEEDLALLNAEDKFYYTNHTADAPKNEASLQRIAGWGNSPLAQYDGTGAYFLDKIADGVWRLEVYPDALITDNPYGRNSLQKTVAVIQWNERSMELRLRDLGNAFRIQPLNSGNSLRPEVRDGAFRVRPGVYLLTREGATISLPAATGALNMREFAAPPPTAARTYLVHAVPEKATAGKSLPIEVQVLTQAPDPTVRLLVQIPMRTVWIPMQKKHGFTYEAAISDSLMQPGLLNYYILVESEGKTETFPAGRVGMPFDWDFTNRQTYTVRVFAPAEPVELFGPQSDWDRLTRTRWLPSLRHVPLGPPHEAEYQILVDRLHEPDPEDLNGPVIQDYTIHQFLNNQIEHLHASLAGKEMLVILGRSLSDRSTPVQLTLTAKDGSAYGAVVQLQPGMQEHAILLSSLRPVQAVLMPRPYPTFLPYYFKPEDTPPPFDLQRIEGLQISIGPGIPSQELESKHGIAVSRIWLR